MARSCFAATPSAGADGVKHSSILDDVIAQTEILLPTDPEEAPSLVLHIARPAPADVDWQCKHQLTGLAGEDDVVTAYGVDSFQALELCIQLANARLLDLKRRIDARMLS